MHKTEKNLSFSFDYECTTKHQNVEKRLQNVELHQRRKHSRKSRLTKRKKERKTATLTNLFS
jgi:hypothetical protein